MQSSSKRRATVRRPARSTPPRRTPADTQAVSAQSTGSTLPRATQIGSTTARKSPTIASAAKPSVRKTAPKSTTAKRTSPTQRVTTASRQRQHESLVHDAAHRAYRSTIGQLRPNTSINSEERSTDNYAAECERLREDLQRVMADHQRQADEIVALRALARSMKEEVETMQEAMKADVATHRRRRGSLKMERTHEFFQLDEQIDLIRAENEQLRARMESVEKDKHDLQAIVDNEIPRFEQLTVQARAELESVMSQLLEEQAANDALRNEIVYYRARSTSPMRAQRVAPTRHRPTRQPEHHDARLRSEDLEGNKENGLRGNEPVDRRRDTANDDALRSSLMSSMASLSMSAASQFSTLLQDDIQVLRGELRQLHRTIDASVVKSHSAIGRQAFDRSSRASHERTIAELEAEDEWDK